MNLEQWVVEQRWFASKSREVSEVAPIERTEVADGLWLTILQVTFATGTHELYQVFLDPEGEERVPGRELLERMARGGEEGDLRYEWVGGPLPGGEVRPIGVEQSNTSIVFGERVILKLLRRLEPGDNPELELLRFLTERGFSHIAPLEGWYEHEGSLIDATLGIAQRFERGRDGWGLALESLAGDGFVDEARALGAVTGELHTVLGSEAADPHFAPEEISEEGLALLVATVDEEIERTFRDMPANEATAGLAGREQDVREQLSALSHIGVGGRVIRSHGDYHLGQTLRTERGWIVLDFEGEPARSLPERRKKRSPLRDVAGMLRSFAYAGVAAEAAPDWEAAVRTAFLEAYLGAVDPGLLPPGEEAVRKLLAIFELEKAIYELRYELDNRPDWVAIPATGITRLLEES